MRQAILGLVTPRGFFLVSLSRGCSTYIYFSGSLGRVVMLVLFLALMFLYTSYSANIVALLQSSSSHIKTLEDLLHSRIKFGVHDTVFNRYYFSVSLISSVIVIICGYEIEIMTFMTFITSDCN